MLCRKLGITSLKEQAGSLAVEFSKLSNVLVIITPEPESVILKEAQ